MGWGRFCVDNEECIPLRGIHMHADFVECQRYLRQDTRFADIRDDQCCACYFGEYFDIGGCNGTD